MIKIEMALLCDEVRREDNGKLIIIGVYTPGMELAEFPANIAPCVWIKFAPLGKEDMNIEIRAKDKKRPRSQLLRGKGKIHTDNPDQPIFLALPQRLMKVDEPTTIVFEIREVGGRWKTVLETPLTLSN